MDTEDIFRKLSVGAVYKKQRKPKINTSCSEKVQPSTCAGHEPVLAEDASRKKDEIINHIRNKHKINVEGKNVPSPICDFSELGSRYKLSERLLDNIQKCGYTAPTPIQMQAIPLMLENRQLLACAPTGSGKTASFLIPVIHKLRAPRTDGFRVLIVSPTRELSRQTFRECERLCNGTGIKIHLTTKLKESVSKPGVDISKKFDILITTPNRLIHILNMEPPVLSLKSVQWFIVDESDKLFETGVRGFRDQLAVIYQACDSKNVKRAMFSATHTVEVAKWCRHNLKGLVLVNIGHRNTTVDTVEQDLIYVGNEEGKLIAIRDLIKQGLNPPVLIFLQSKERARELFQELIYDGINVDVIHADRTQKQRDNVVKAFREGKIWVLICTELMGRGIDFKGVNLVINYDFPPTAISYIHRVGRTGRAGRPGKAVTFFTDDDKPYLRSIANVMKESGCPVPEYILKLKRPHKKIRRKLESNLPDRQTISTNPRKRKLLATKSKEKQKKVSRNKETSKSSEQDDDTKQENLKRKQSDEEHNEIQSKKKKNKQK